MRHLVAAALIVSSFGLFDLDHAFGQDDAPAQAIFPFPIQRTELSNGLTVMSVKYDSPNIIAYYTIVRTGSRNEVEPGLSGFAHFFEHMMFRGTPRYSESEYNETLKGLGADSNAFTSDDWTCYHTTASKASLDKLVELESDRFQNLKYNEPEFQKEARAVLGEYNKSASSPLLLLEEKLQDTAFTRHTYKHTTIGFLRDIEDMPKQYEYSLKFFDRWYRPENCIVLVVGDVEHQDLVALAENYYGGWKKGTAKVEIPTEPAQTRENRVDLLWNGQTLPYLLIGYHIPGFDPKNHDVAALDVLAESAFSETSALYRKLVLEERKAELIRAEAPGHRDPTLFTVMARLTAPEHFDSVRDEIYRTLNEAVTNPLPAERLNDIKSHMRYAFAMQLDSADAVARTLGEYLQLTGDESAVNHLYETYDAVTAREIQTVAHKYFVPENRTVITLRSDTARSSGCCADTVIPSQSIAELADQAEQPGTALESTAALTDPLVGPVEYAEFAAIEAGCTGLDDRQVDIRKDNVPMSEIILPNPDSPLVALRILFDTGSKDDPPGREGLACLTTRMLAEGGTKRYSYDEILDRLYPIAAEIESHCDKEVISFSARVHRDKLLQFYDLFSEMLIAPRFDPEDFARLHEEQLNYVSKVLRGNNDEALGKWTLQGMLYPGHPYGHVDEGTISGLSAIRLPDVKEFYNRYLGPLSGRIRIGAAGGFDEQFVARLRKDFRTTPPRVSRAALARPHLPNGIELTIVQKNCIATAISIGFPIEITRADDDFYPLAVANSALGEHRTFNGRLMRNMRGKRGLNYGDYSYIENFIQDGGSTFPIPNIPRPQQYFSIWVRPVPHDKAMFALRQAIRELDLIVKDGLGEKEFESTRVFLRNYSKLWVQTQSRSLGYEMDGSSYGRMSLTAELEKRLPTITRQQVNAAIAKNLQSRRLCVAVVTSDAAAFRDALLSGVPTPLKYDTAGTPTDILEEDKEIERFPLPVRPESIRIVAADEMFQ